MPPSAASRSLSAIEEDEIMDISIDEGYEDDGNGNGSIEVNEDGDVVVVRSSNCASVEAYSNTIHDNDWNSDIESSSKSVSNSLIFSGLSLADEEEVPVDEEEEGIETPSELLTILDSLLYGCVGCEPCAGSAYSKPPRGGILKKRDPMNKDPRQQHHNQSPGSPSNMHTRSVSFSSCDIKAFNMTLGNNPCAVSGPPVMLDWDSKPTFERVMSLDEYERSRTPRRKRSQLKLSYRDRKGILEGQQGFSTEEVNRAWAEAIKVRQQRHETLQRGILLSTLDDAWESAQRKCYRVAEAVGMA